MILRFYDPLVFVFFLNHFASTSQILTCKLPTCIWDMSSMTKLGNNIPVSCRLPSISRGLPWHNQHLLGSPVSPMFVEPSETETVAITWVLLFPETLLDIGITSLRDAHLEIWILMKKTALAHQGQNINGFLSDLEKQNPLCTHKWGCKTWKNSGENPFAGRTNSRLDYPDKNIYFFVSNLRNLLLLFYIYYALLRQHNLLLPSYWTRVPQDRQSLAFVHQQEETPMAFRWQVQIYPPLKSVGSASWLCSLWPACNSQSWALDPTQSNIP